MRKARAAASLLAASFLLATGWPTVDSRARASQQQCAAAGPELNAPLCAVDASGGYRVAAIPGASTGGLFLILTFSGGGTRAAAFSLGALTALRDVRATALGNASLLDMVSVISSVSGGSFTSAFYGLFRDDIFPACHEDSCGDKANDARPFYKRMLYRNIQKELALRALWPPTNVMRRSEFAAKMYSSTIFDDKSFADLMATGRPKKPFILLNSTDIGMSSRFEFSQDQFDYLCSDLSQVKVGTGVGASAAFPVLLDTIPMRNYGWTSCGYNPPDWVRLALRQFTSNPRRFEKAQYLMTYKPEGRRYIHLLDGGLADNIGLRAPIEAVETDDFPGVGGWRLTEKMLNDDVKRVAVISVDAKTIHPQDWDCCRQPPGFFTGFDVATSIPHSRFSFETLELWREIVARQKSALQEAGTLTAFNNVTIHFDGIPDADEPVRTHLFELPTAFSLPRADVDLLVSWGYKLVKRSPELRELCEQLGGCTGLEPAVSR